MVNRIVAFLVSAYYVIIGWLMPRVYDYEVIENVRYAEAECAVMDVYLPESAVDREENGCVIMIHGGAWSGGDKGDERARCHRLARRGYVVASINYTLYAEGQGYTVDTVLDEIDTAIAALRDMSAERGITLTAAAIAGYSAGGHLAMLYAYQRADTAPLPIRFVATLAGPADISHAVWGDSAYRIAEWLTGTEITPADVDSDKADALAARISPTQYITADSVPTLMAYGERDTIVPIGNADALAAALSEAGVEYTDIRFSRSDHGMMGNPFKRMKYNRTLVRFCVAYFGY